MQLEGNLKVFGLIMFIMRLEMALSICFSIALIIIFNATIQIRNQENKIKEKQNTNINPEEPNVFDKEQSPNEDNVNKERLETVENLKE